MSAGEMIVLVENQAELKRGRKDENREGWESWEGELL